MGCWRGWDSVYLTQLSEFSGGWYLRKLIGRKWWWSLARCGVWYPSSQGAQTHSGYSLWWGCSLASLKPLYSLQFILWFSSTSQRTKYQQLTLCYQLRSSLDKGWAVWACLPFHKSDGEPAISIWLYLAYSLPCVDCWSLKSLKELNLSLSKEMLLNKKTAKRTFWRTSWILLN